MKKIINSKSKNLNKMTKLDETIKRKIIESEGDYENGRIKKADDVFKEWKEIYGI